MVVYGKILLKYKLKVFTIIVTHYNNLLKVERNMMTNPINIGML